MMDAMTYVLVIFHKGGGGAGGMGEKEFQVHPIFMKEAHSNVLN
jgi:hypothetical protein